MEKIAEKIGKRIRYFRKKQNLSQEKLALEAGINPAFLGHLERGIKSPTATTLAKISDALNITMSELVFFDSEENQNENNIRKITAAIEKLPPEKAKVLTDIVVNIAHMIEE